VRGMPRNELRRTAALIGPLLAIIPAATLGSEEVAWYTGSRHAKQLSASIDHLIWRDNPLRRALEGLAEARRTAILLDRRVDPGQKVSLRASKLPLSRLFSQTADQIQAGVSQFGSVTYFGPRHTALRLRTLGQLRMEDARRLPGDASRRFLHVKPLAWDDLTTPRELLAKLATESGITIEGIERVPHDLWGAADLPPLTLVARLTLIAVQFDLTFDIASDGRTIRLVPIPADVSLVRSYDGKRDPQAVAQGFAALSPSARIKVVGRKVYVKGTIEDHERLVPRKPQVASRTNQTHRPRAGDESDVSLVRIERLSQENVAVGRLLDALAAATPIELQIDRKAIEAAGLSLDKRVSINLRGATVDEALTALLTPAGLAFRRQGKLVEVGPANAP